MYETMFLGFVLRFLQCLLQASPFILAGLFVAGVFHRFLGYEGTRRLFGGTSKRGLLQAWGIGMLLPVCSLGVIPVVREMRKAGLPGGTILAFAMAAPLFNPLSVLYGLTLSEPIAIFTFVGCSLVVVTVIGLVWDRLFRQSDAPEPVTTAIPPGARRMAAVGVTACREMVGPSLMYIVIGLAGVALLGALVPHGSLQSTMNHDNVFAPLLMAALAIPVYATPMLAMSQIGMMFQHANSIGAAFVLLALGAGMNVGLIAWMMRNYGVKRSVAWFVFLLVVVIGLAYGVERPLFPSSVIPADHTHAFDIYARPFPADSQISLPDVITKLKRDIQVYEWYSAVVLAGIFCIGLILRIADRSGRIDAWLEAAPERSKTTGRFDVVIPGPILAAIALVGLVVVSIVGCFAYYPPPEEALDQMSSAKAECLSAAMAGDKLHADYWIENLDDWSRKLEVGVYLRDHKLSDYHRMKTRLLRDKLELLQHEIEEGDKEEISRMVADVNRAVIRVRRAYTEDR